jgi:hypothetical protein
VAHRCVNTAQLAQHFLEDAGEFGVVATIEEVDFVAHLIESRLRAYGRESAVWPEVSNFNRPGACLVVLYTNIGRILIVLWVNYYVIRCTASGFPVISLYR